jgi:REP element-mobilizing transposase RayT
LCWRVIPGRQLEPDDRTLVLDAIRFWDERRWRVFVAVVMPDHVHTIVKPLPADPNTGAVPDLGELLRSVKGFSARVVNRRQSRTGTLWQDERYDRIIRDERELAETWDYIRFNPVTAGLAETPEQYAWLYEKVLETL